MKTLSADDWDDRNDLRLSQKPSALLIRKKFGLDAAKVEKKKWNKNVPTECGHYLSKKSPFHQVFEVTSLCLRGTLQRREKKRMVRHEVRSTIKIHHFGLFAKHAQKFHLPTEKHRWRPGASCFWGDRDDCMEITNRPSRPDCLEIFWNDWGDRDDHMETRA